MVWDQFMIRKVIMISFPYCVSHSSQSWNGTRYSLKMRLDMIMLVYLLIVLQRLVTSRLTQQALIMEWTSNQWL